LDVLRRTTALRERAGIDTDVVGRAPGVGERAARQVLDLASAPAEIVGGPASERVVHRRVEPEEHGSIPTAPSTMSGRAAMTAPGPGSEPTLGRQPPTDRPTRWPQC
jgi:hypothetical protein